jgi:hypothetical protein
VGNVATVTYLKAEDSDGHLQDILGRHQRLPFQAYGGSTTSTTFRFYIDLPQHIKTSDKKLYLAVQNSSGSMVTTNASLENTMTTTTLYRDMSISGDHRTSQAYYELYIFDTNDDKIILSSGYTGGQP